MFARLGTRNFLVVGVQHDVDATVRLVVFDFKVVSRVLDDSQECEEWVDFFDSCQSGILGGVKDSSVLWQLRGVTVDEAVGRQKVFRERFQTRFAFRGGTGKDVDSETTGRVELDFVDQSDRLTGHASRDATSERH